MKDDIPPPRTQQQSADLIAKLDALTRSSDTSVVSDIKKYQADHRSYVLSNFGRFTDQFYMFFSALVDYSHNINYLDKKHWPGNRGLQFIIATNALKQFHTAYDLLEEGSYEDCITILRSVYESFLRIVFISCNPAHAGNAYSFPGQSGPRFNATNLVKDELGLDWSTYSITSAFAHSNNLKVMEDAIAVGIDKENWPIRLSYELNDDYISMITNLINFMLTAFLDMYDQLFTIDLSKHNDKSAIQPHLDKFHEYALICHDNLRSHNANEYWRQTAVDLEDILELMKLMDSDSTANWKQVWQHIRQPETS